MDSLNEVWNYDADYHKVCNLLGLNAVKRQDSRMHKRVTAIVDSLGGKTINQTCERLVKLRQSSGSNELGELLINRLYFEARLRGEVASEKAQLDKERKVKAEQKAMKEVDKLEKQVKEEREYNDTLRSIQTERAEKQRLEALYKEQTGREFVYA